MKNEAIRRNERGFPQPGWGPRWGVWLALALWVLPHPAEASFDSTAASTISWFYAAAFSRTPVPNSTLPEYGDIGGLAFWTNAYLTGTGGLAPYRGNVYAIADFFVTSNEFQDRYPASLTNAAFITALYANMLERAPDPGGLGFWVGQLDAGVSRGAVLADFTNSEENRNSNPLRQAALASFIAFVAADADETITPAEAAAWLAQNPTLDGVLVDGASPALTRLNDTGISWCANDTTDDLPCPVSGYPGQDGDHGRDALARDGQLPKVGGGNAGFDFTKIANSGAELPATAPLGSGPTDWACTRDNHTGLIWEVKTTSGLRSVNHTYTWYDPNSPDGNPGVANGGTCTGSACDTSGYVQAVNQQGLCGASDWRMPRRRELQGIVDYSRPVPAIDTGYFPNTPTSYFWSASPRAKTLNDVEESAWYVFFYRGYAGYGLRSKDYRVRLVRGGP